MSRRLCVAAIILAAAVLGTGTFLTISKWRSAVSRPAPSVAAAATLAPAPAPVPNNLTVTLSTGEQRRVRVDPRVWGHEYLTLIADAAGVVSVAWPGGDALMTLAVDATNNTWTGIEVLDDAERVVVTSLYAERLGDVWRVSLFGASSTALLYQVRGAEKSWNEGRLSTEALEEYLQLCFVRCEALPGLPAHRLRVLDVVRGEA